MKKTIISGYLNKVKVAETIVTHQEGSTREIALVIHDMGVWIGKPLHYTMKTEII